MTSRRTKQGEGKRAGEEKKGEGMGGGGGAGGGRYSRHGAPVSAAPTCSIHTQKGRAITLHVSGGEGAREREVDDKEGEVGWGD